MKTMISLLMAFLLVVVSSCQKNDLEPDENKVIELDEKSAQLIEAENEFGFELYQHVFSSETKENIMVSPLSVSLALAMTYNGADGETKTAMEKTLKMYGLTPGEINTSYQTLIKALKELDPEVLLEIANAIYYRNDFPVEQNFITTNQKYYDAEVSALDFGSPNALKTINKWVADKTNDKIETILNEITREQVMFLLNAIYFKGTWKSEFEKKNTAKNDFHLENGSTVQADFMQQTNTAFFSSNELFSAIRLPYGQGNFNMYVFLPHADKTLQDITDNLNKDNWEFWMENFSEQNVNIQFPKFKYEYEIKLNDVLSEMGMGVAFIPGAADFTGINRAGGLYIDYVKHKSFIEVDEKGTEAAAATVVAIGYTSVGPGGNIPFIVNRPFMYAITEKSTGAVLFMGTVKNPQVN